MTLTVNDQHTLRVPVMEMFYTLQGEGSYQGKAAYFVRLGGCDVGCVWCDVKDSWDASKHPMLSIQEIIDKINQEVPQQKEIRPFVVITGGEPLMHDLSVLTHEIQKQGYRTHLETSGAHPLTGEWNWICLSPKKFKAPLPVICAEAHELKVVIYHPSDFAWAEQYAAAVPKNCKLYLQPEWDKAEKITL